MCIKGQFLAPDRPLCLSSSAAQTFVSESWGRHKYYQSVSEEKVIEQCKTGKESVEILRVFVLFIHSTKGCKFEHHYSLKHSFNIIHPLKHASCLKQKYVQTHCHY